MPIYDMPYYTMKQLSEDGHVCAECNGRLGVAWIGSKTLHCKKDGSLYWIEPGWILRCGNDITHNKITRHDKEFEKKMNMVQMDSTALTKLNENQMIARIGMAKFPQDLAPVEKRTLAIAAISYGFDPLMGEITLYQGRPYISIDGRYRKAQETGQLKKIFTYPANEQERKDWGIPDGDFFFKAVVETVNGGEFTGWGRVYSAELMGGKGFKPVEKNPQRMAEKRAEAQALRKAFHIPLPSLEDIGMLEEPTIPPVSVVVEKTGDKTPEAVKDTTAAENKPLIDLEWLEEALKTLKARNVMGYSNALIVKELNALTGQQAKSVSESVANLKPEHAELARRFVAGIQKVLEATEK